MIVIGVDVHKQSLTAAAVDETGRLLAERTLAGGEDGCSFGRRRCRLSGCGPWRTAATSPGRWSASLSRPASGWCGCRRS